MEDTQKNSTKIWIIYGVTGFLIGVCLVSLSTIGLIAYQTANPPPTQTPLPTPTVAVKDLLNRAEKALNVDGNPQLVLDLLKPHLEEFTETNDLTKALEYLSSAEMRLGHFQLATVYLERLCQIAPTPQNYAALARIYDAGGDVENALKYYILYLKTDDPVLTDDLRIMLQDRVNQLQTILTNSTPTATQ